jgi:hypothetical protein
VSHNHPGGGSVQALVVVHERRGKARSALCEGQQPFSDDEIARRRGSHWDSDHVAEIDVDMELGFCGRTAQIIWPTCACHCLTVICRVSSGNPNHPLLLSEQDTSQKALQYYNSLYKYVNILYWNKQRKTYKP